MLLDAPARDLSVSSDPVPDRYPHMDQSRESSCSPRLLANGKESYAVSSDATSLQQGIIELADRLFLLIGDAPLRDSLLPALVNQSNAPREIEEESSSAAHAYRQLEARLHTAFEIDPLEDGITHPAEEIIGSALQSNSEERVLEWLKTFSMDTMHPSFAASVLRCLGRLGRTGGARWRASVVQQALTEDNVEMRDAAVQAAESWGDSEIRQTLQAHSEPERWLRKYIEDVIDDLKE